MPMENVPERLYGHDLHPLDASVAKDVDANCTAKFHVSWTHCMEQFDICSIGLQGNSLSLSTFKQKCKHIFLDSVRDKHHPVPL